MAARWTLEHRQLVHFLHQLPPLQLACAKAVTQALADEAVPRLGLRVADPTRCASSACPWAWRPCAEPPAAQRARVTRRAPAGHTSGRCDAPPLSAHPS